jgi:hypothetical protein
MVRRVVKTKPLPIYSDISVGFDFTNVGEETNFPVTVGVDLSADTECNNVIQANFSYWNRRFPTTNIYVRNPFCIKPLPPPQPPPVPSGFYNRPPFLRDSCGGEVERLLAYREYNSTFVDLPNHLNQGRYYLDQKDTPTDIESQDPLPWPNE